MWTMTNTEGFTQEHLDTINEARAAILKESCTDAPHTDEAFAKHIDDALTNEWVEDISADDLRDAVLARFGVMEEVHINMETDR